MFLEWLSESLTIENFQIFESNMLSKRTCLLSILLNISSKENYYLKFGCMLSSYLFICLFPILMLILVFLCKYLEWFAGEIFLMLIPVTHVNLFYFYFFFFFKIMVPFLVFTIVLPHQACKGFHNEVYFYFLDLGLPPWKFSTRDPPQFELCIRISSLFRLPKNLYFQASWRFSPRYFFFF